MFQLFLVIWVIKTMETGNCPHFLLKAVTLPLKYVPKNNS